MFKITKRTNYKRLKGLLEVYMAGLQQIIDGDIPYPETEEELEAAICIKAAMPNLCLQLARLGVDLPAVNETFFKGE
jgi:hypothetical protein